MFPNITFLNLTLAALTFLIVYIIFNLYIRPRIKLLYYKHQAIPTRFYPELTFMPQFTKDLQQTGEFYHTYHQLLDSRPKMKAIAENFMSKVRVTLFDPQVIKEFLRSTEVFIKDTSFTGLLKEMLPNLLTFTEGAEWKSRRRMLARAFNFEFLEESVPMIVAVTQEKFACWIQQGDLVGQNLKEMLTLITSEVGGRFMLGKSFQECKMKGVPVGLAGLKVISDCLADAISLPSLLFGSKIAHLNLLPRHRKLNADIAEIKKLSREMVRREVERNDEDATKFVKLVREMRENTGSEYHYTDNDIADDFLGFMLAGTDTTAHLVASVIYFLWKHPHIYAEVKKEVDREFADLSALKAENLNRMSYTLAVLKETQRLGGPMSMILDRVATEDTDLCGLRISKGTLVNLCFDAFFKSENYYSRPTEFLPERWLGDPVFEHDGSKKETYAFTPFSAGPRNCIGQHLAMIEARIMLALFIKTFDFSFADDYQFKLIVRLMYETQDPLLVSLKPKKLLNNF